MSNEVQNSSGKIHALKSVAYTAGTLLTYHNVFNASQFLPLLLVCRNMYQANMAMAEPTQVDSSALLYT
jgi:hypothetical protein